ncbi:MAG TPA: A24 family peptidase C-terminal domain-containing protein [Nitrosopumilaceae archaeon]|nr:A24 family peptidase C-terminal domain-containing protein [Nitrosopumilaceae archaeon]
MFEFMFDVYNIRILSALIMLSIATIIDVWKREINDILWIVFGVISVVLIFFEPSIPDSMINIGVSLIVAPIALLIWRVGIFGGADALGLIVLAALAPQLSFSGNTVTPLTTLTNAAIISVVPVFLNLIRNFIAISRHKNIFEGFEETKLKKIAAMFLGYRAENPKYGFAIEKVEGNHKKIDFSFHHAENTEFCDKPDTWVTPGIPYILYITVGFVVQLLFGDIVFNIGNLW